MDDDLTIELRRQRNACVEQMRELIDRVRNSPLETAHDEYVGSLEKLGIDLLRYSALIEAAAIVDKAAPSQMKLLKGLL